jgi:hypothetical protein
MLLDARSTPRHPYRALMIVVASAVALVLPFVTPVDGARVSLDHELQLVHPIFVHVHGHVHGKDAPTVEASSWADPMPPIVAITSMGQTGAGLGVATESMLSVAVLLLLLVQPSLRLRGRGVGAQDQYLRAVPTGPPRPRSFA